MRSLVASIVALAFTASAYADHTIKVSVTVNNGGKVGSHVSRYDGPVKIGADMDGHQIRVPTGGSHFTKLMSRDDDSNPKRVTQGNPWTQEITVGGRGIYIFDLSDWDNNPDVTVELIIDGKTRFRGHGNKKNYKQWNDKYYGPGARQTDDREIAIDVGGD